MLLKTKRPLDELLKRVNKNHHFDFLPAILKGPMQISTLEASDGFVDSEASSLSQM